MPTKATVRKSETLSSTSLFSDSISAACGAYKKQVCDDKRLQLIDAFLTFLVVVGVVQFGFICVVRDSFPLNAFLAGFSACVGQFVLLMSLRMQWVDSFAGIKRERAFMEFVGASLVLHFVCLHFVN
ncbi:LANO_0H13432g1_1 [Lachancea nothofagi CBS 11611]|uniref:Dolichyl-diphosphooligosaccharide--protein glycosyltransferase subunit OST2 n=1 Tax=Lachancea nothofagi CBS 11611 TaxID=1266666 RepID=A0A1G4KMG5_9SACH|nr:LANO_0H13432g1_1 [Lachancea nothofagi CBS 11611]